MSESREISPIQRLVLAAAGRRAATVEWVIALDNECAHIARTAREPMMAQIRLAWWRDGLAAAEAMSAHRSPMMDALRAVVDYEVIRHALIAMVDGWEELILWDGEDRSAMLDRYAQGRGEGMFLALAPERGNRTQPWGAIWALWDMAGHLDDADLAAAAIEHGQMLAKDISAPPSSPRVIAMLGGVARRDLRNGRGMPRNLTPGLYMRLLRLQIFGR